MLDPANEHVALDRVAPARRTPDDRDSVPDLPPEHFWKQVVGVGERKEHDLCEPVLGTLREIQDERGIVRDLYVIFMYKICLRHRPDTLRPLYYSDFII